MKKALINVSVCLSDIPKEKLIQDKKGKIYLEIIISGKKKDQFDNDVKVVFTTKEEEKAKYEKPYIGDGRWVSFAPESAECLPNQFIKGLFDVTEIPPAFIREGSNGKKYLNLTIVGKKDNETKIIGYISQSEEQRKAKSEKEYHFEGELFNYKEKAEDMAPVAYTSKLSW